MARRDDQIVAGIDLGTSKTSAIVAEATGDLEAPIKVLGIGLSRTTGVKRGQVRDIEAATQGVAQALGDAQRMAGVEVRKVVCGVATSNVLFKNSPGMVSVTGEEVSAGDVARVNEIARRVSLGRDHDLVHAIPQEYRVDQHGGISDPIGMAGLRLEADVLLVGGQRSALQNLRKAIERAQFKVSEFVLDPLAAAVAVLTDEERELGCALVDIGASCTSMIIIEDHKIRHVAAIPYAGSHVTSDLVHGLSVTQADAEQLKQRYGLAHEGLADPDETIDLPSTPGQGDRHARRELIAHIVHQRLEEIFDSLIRREIDGVGFAEGLTSGIVITGGTAHLPGIVDLAREVLALPARLGEPVRGITGLAESVQGPRFAVPVGLVWYAAQRMTGITSTGERPAMGPDRLFAPVKRWLQDFF